MLDTGVSIFIMPQSQNTSLCSSSIDIKHESSGTNITTHTQVQPVIDVPAKTNASTGQVVSPPAEGGVVKTTPTQEALPTTSTVSEDQVPSQNTTGADRPQIAVPKSRQTAGIMDLCHRRVVQESICRVCEGRGRRGWGAMSVRSLRERGGGGG